jgi:AcrR family transcriptional regulator
MLDLTSPDGRLLSAALGLAAERPWGEVTLADIAERAGTSLVEFKAHFASKGEILAAFSRLVDDEMLRRAPKRSEGQTPRDALFEVIMCRFDVLGPYKGALRSVMASGLPEPALIGQLLTSQGWILEAAGISSGGLEGGMRAAGLATLYSSVARTWLDDDDPGLARTMAALDRRLRRGQRTIERVEDVCKGVRRAGESLASILRGPARRRPGDPTAAPPADVPPTSAA